MQRILVTGATSFAGVSLVSHLANSGVDVHVLARPGTDRSRFSEFGVDPIVHVLGAEGAADAASLARLIEKAEPDVVIHLAGHYLRDHRSSDLEPLVNDNLLLGVQLLEAMKAAGASAMVTAGSYFQYAGGPEYAPVNLYAALKQAFGYILKYYIDADDFRAISLIIFDTYGPRDWRPRLMAAIRHAQLSGEALALPADNLPIDMLYIDDLCAAFAVAAKRVSAEDFTPARLEYSLASGEDVKLDELVEIFAEVGGRPISVQAGAYPAQARNVSKLWQGPALPGWRAQVSLRDGIRKFIDGYGES